MKTNMRSLLWLAVALVVVFQDVAALSLPRRRAPISRRQGQQQQRRAPTVKIQAAAEGAAVNNEGEGTATIPNEVL